ncbi:MAG: hypothetical protein HOE90_08750 [Bacteriovoracaceae bacterium]|jgi:hypothetical protein|nr:hypothetical protein [Bacteriovoracaceae bacterium]
MNMLLFSLLIACGVGQHQFTLDDVEGILSSKTEEQESLAMLLRTIDLFHKPLKKKKLSISMEK